MWQVCCFWQIWRAAAGRLLDGKYTKKNLCRPPKQLFTKTLMTHRVNKFPRRKKEKNPFYLALICHRAIFLDCLLHELHPRFLQAFFFANGRHSKNYRRKFTALSLFFLSLHDVSDPFRSLSDRWRNTYAFFGTCHKEHNAQWSVLIWARLFWRGRQSQRIPRVWRDCDSGEIGKFGAVWGTVCMAGLAGLASIASLVCLTGLAGLVGRASLASLMDLPDLADLTNLASLADLTGMKTLADVSGLAGLAGVVGVKVSACLFRSCRNCYSASCCLSCFLTVHLATFIVSARTLNVNSRDGGWELRDTQSVVRRLHNVYFYRIVKRSPIGSDLLPQASFCVWKASK